MQPTLSVVVPLYNEEEVLPEFNQALCRVMSNLGTPYEIIYVNDGSRDGTWRLLCQYSQAQTELKVINLSRNFGHQAALTAGLAHATGLYVVSMDGDMQDPPDLIPKMLDATRQGCDVVLAQRKQREGETAFKRWTAACFYKMMKRLLNVELPEQVGDFRLMSRKSLDALLQMEEQHRFLRGMVAWIGYETRIIEFDRPARAAGATKYPVYKMLKLAWNGVTSFSAVPLYILFYLGLILSAAGMLYAAYAVLSVLIFHNTVKGWASIAAVLCVFSGFNLIAIGLVGAYLGKIFEEVKRRPLFLIRDKINFSSESKHERILSK